MGGRKGPLAWKRQVSRHVHLFYLSILRCAIFLLAVFGFLVQKRAGGGVRYVCVYHSIWYAPADGKCVCVCAFRGKEEIKLGWLDRYLRYLDSWLVGRWYSGWMWVCMCAI